MEPKLSNGEVGFIGQLLRIEICTPNLGGKTAKAIATLILDPPTPTNMDDILFAKVDM